jgi:hypothetical protein
VATDEIIGYRGKRRLRTYQGVEGDKASSVAKSTGSRWSETVGIPHRSLASGQRDLVGDEGIDLGQMGASGDVREVRKIMGSRGYLIASVQVTCHRWNRR